MSNRFSLAYLTVPGCTPPEQVRIAAAAGYDFVGLRLIPLGVSGEPAVDPVTPALIRAPRCALNDTGLRVLDIELARILRDVAPQCFLPAMAAAAELGARQMICSAWTTVRNDRAFIVERFAEICDLAAPFGLTVNLEYPAFSRLTCLEDATDILRAARCPNQGLLVDTLYYHFSHGRAAAIAALPRQWFNLLHLCDSVRAVPATRDEMIRIAREDRLYPGEGSIDFAAITAALPPVPIAIELPNARHLAALGPEGHARACLDAARACLAFRPAAAPRSSHAA